MVFFAQLLFVQPPRCRSMENAALVDGGRRDVPAEGGRDGESAEIPSGGARSSERQSDRVKRNGARRWMEERERGLWWCEEG